jgi:DNA-binding response OmpR family regulator
MNILLIEDEKDIADSIINYLNTDGYHCEWANTFESGIEKIHLYSYDCILVDITLPGGNGLDIISEVKEMKNDAGVIIISAKNALDDRILGLEIGSDDYLTKPFDLAELNARIKAVIRRRNFEGQNHIKFEEITISPYEHWVKVNGKSLTLTKKEFDLMLYFASNPNRVITKESIAEHLWGDHMDGADSFDFIYAHLKNLRRKISENGGKDYIKTIYGIGYKLIRE